MSLTVHTPRPSLLPTVWKLLTLRWRINVNSFRHAKPRTKFLTILLYVAAIVFAGFVFWVSSAFLRFVSSPTLVIYTGINGAPFMDTIPAAVFSIMFFGILLSSFGVLLQALYLSGDMDFLLAAPVPIRAVFITKLLQAVLPNFSLMAVFGLPLLYGLGAARGYNFLFYPLVLIVMVMLTLAAAGLSSLLVMLVVRVFPARRIAEVLGFVGVTMSILCSQSANLMNLSRRGPDFSGRQTLNALIPLLNRFNDPWFPPNWAGRGLVELGSGNWLIGALLVVLTLGLLSGAFWFALVTAERWYYTGWAGMQVVARKKRNETMQRTSNVARETIFSRLGTLIPATVRGIVQKDFLMLTRDLRKVSQLVTPLIFGVVYAAALLRNGPPPSGTDPIFLSLFNYSSIGVALMVGSSLVTRLGNMGFSQEGKNYWMLKVSPVHPWHLLIAKFVVAYLPGLVMSSLVVVILSVIQATPIFSVFYNWVVVAVCLVQMAGILVAVGVPGANFVWDDPRQMVSGRFGCLGMIIVGAYTLLTFAIIVAPPALAVFLGQPEIYGRLIGLFLGSIFSLGGAFAALWLVSDRVGQLGEGV